MTTAEALKVGLGYERLGYRNFALLTGLSLVFSGIVLLLPEINETDAYAELRLMLAALYAVPACATILAGLHFAACARAAARLDEGAPGSGTLRPVGVLWPLFFLPAQVILTQYVILTYAVDGGLF